MPLNGYVEQTPTRLHIEREKDARHTKVIKRQSG
jgi:hypothetical protein